MLSRVVKKNDKEHDQDFKTKAIQETKGIFWALLAALVIRTFLYQAFSIPSGSMYPTLMVGDYLVVEKFAYGYSNYSYFLQPKIHEGRILAGHPTRGEVVVFTGDKDESIDYIKRAVGLPGDRIQMIDGILHINGKACKLKQIEDYHMVSEDGRLMVIPQYIETIPGSDGNPDVEHRILKAIPFGQARYDNTPEYTVPEGHYFMVGDNRDRSADSRTMRTIGFVKYDHLIGPAKGLFFSTEAKWHQLNKWLSGIRFDRMFTAIR